MALKFSHELIVLIEKERCQPLTVGDVLAETSERSFCLIIVFLAFPFLLPTIPGITTILGSGCLLISLQMAWGSRHPWLPKRIAAFHFSEEATTRLLTRLKQAVLFAEKVAKPRWSRMTRSDYAWRINGVCISWLALLLMLPVPLTNPLPTIGILLLAVAMLETDGLLMFLGYVAVGINTALFGTVGFLLWRSPEIIQRWLTTTL